MNLAKIVWANLRNRPGRSLLTLVGISVAVSAGAAIFAVVRGFECDLIDKYEVRGTQMIVSGATKRRPLPMLIDEAIGHALTSLPGVVTVAGALYEMGSVEGQTPLTLLGWPRGSYLWNHLSFPPEHNSSVEGMGTTIYLGTVAARYLKKSPGDTLGMETGEKSTRDLTVGGVFTSSVVVENAAGVMSLAQLQSLLGCVGKVNYFNLQLDPALSIEQVIALQEKIRHLHPELGVMRADEIAANNPGLQAARALGVATSIVALATATLGLTNTLLASVFERSKEISLLMALGWSRSRVVWMILMESVFLALAGAVLGLMVAWGGTFLFANVGMFQGRLVSEFGLDLVLVTLFIAAVAGVLAGLYPALQISRQEPAQALREE